MFITNFKQVCIPVIIAASMTMAFTSCTLRSGDSTANVQVGDDIPAFYLKTPDGTPVGSDDLKSKGQPYVVAVFATWCPPCKTELQAFEKDVWGPLRDSNIGVYAINYGDESADEIREYAQQLGVSFPLLVDEEGDFRSEAGVQGIPTSFVVGKDGRILDIHLGYTDEGVASIKRQLISDAK